MRSYAVLLWLIPLDMITLASLVSVKIRIHIWMETPVCKICILS